MTAWLTAMTWLLAAGAVGMRERRRVAHAARTRHEIRGPLSAALLALGGLEPTARVRAIDLELRRAALALDDLARRPRSVAEIVDVRALLDEMRPAWEALAIAHGATLDPDSNLDATLDGESRLYVRGDRLRLAQGAANLVANAVEHGGGPVAVRASAARGRVRIEVSDGGPGLPAPVPELVAAARGRRSQRGHGLAIVAGIAAAHEGVLTSAPSPRGARLVIDLPAA